ncbi:hypothetical protein PQZ09_01695 [Methylophilaceae bacterium]|jgi:hypothetical protein|nr:hypothetical protein [Methylophilaceae bacterium]
MQKKIITYLECVKHPTFIAVVIALLTTGFLRLQVIGYPPASDSGIYTFVSQWIYNAISQDIAIKDSKLFLYQFMTAWVYGFEVNQIILLRIIDGAIAIVASIVLIKVILKESGSKLFTIILIIPLLIVMHDLSYVIYGFRNSIWAAYLPLFTALLVSQKLSKRDNLSFYIIGALISLGVLLREPFLPFFLLSLIAIFIGYGRRASLKYLIGSAILVFVVLGFILMFREWDLKNLIDRYIFHVAAYQDYKEMGLTLKSGALHLIQTGWFVCIIALVSVFYFIRLKIIRKKSVAMNRFYFWILVALIPLLEPIFKLGFHYHYSNCLIGLAGLSAMGWKYLSLQESNRIKKISILVFGLMSLFIILPTVNSKVINKNSIVSPLDAIIVASNSESFRHSQAIESSQYLTLAAKIYSLSKEDSTLVVTGGMQVLYPLTELLPPTYELSWLRYLYVKVNFDENRLIKIIEKYRPTLIVTTDWYAGEAKMSSIIDKINIYEKVAVVPVNSKKTYGWKSGTIYRLKNF